MRLYQAEWCPFSHRVAPSSPSSESTTSWSTSGFLEEAWGS
jgi:hypothetical protein